MGKKTPLAHQSAEIGSTTPYVMILIITKNNQVYCMGPLGSQVVEREMSQVLGGASGF